MSSMRSKSMIYDWRQSTIYTATSDGHILKLDQDLNLIVISTRHDGVGPFVKIDVDTNFIYGYDVLGRVSRWNKQSLAFEGFDESFGGHHTQFSRRSQPALNYNHDQTEWLLIGEDRHIYQMSNELEPQIIKRMGPFDFKATQVIWARLDLAFLLTEEGEIRRFELSNGS